MRAPSLIAFALAVLPVAAHAQPQPKLGWAGTPMSLSQSGIVPGWIDKSVDPCTDFFRYSCGGFLKSSTIPSDRATWGAITILQQDNEQFLKGVLEDAAAHASATTDPVTQKLGAFYASCMDEAAIEQAGTAPIRPLLDAIAKVADAPSAAQAIILLQSEGYSPFFSLSPTQDAADATQVIASLDQAGIGLPERKFYLDSSDTLPRTRKVYREHQARMFQLLGLDAKTAKLAADHAWKIELALAKLDQTDVFRRDPHNTYHRIELAGLTKAAPAFPWHDLLAALGIGGVTQITAHDPAYYGKVAALLASEPPAVIRDYLTWTVLHGAASDLGKAWVDEAFVMQKELLGLKELPPRWRRCVQEVDGDLGELLGQSYVKAKFGGDSKARAIDLTKAVLAAMRAELAQLPWMDDATRTAAQAKLDKMAYLVGYPDTWRRYDFPVAHDFAANARAATKWELARQLRKIGRPVDRFDWQMTPPTVNAYYEPSLNELALPAGQLQPPFFGQRFHPAVNFGSTGGGTIGHEMTHGFDDEGSLFDGDGNLRDWWSASTKHQFAAATQCVIDQYSKYEAVPGVHLNGKLTAGENIADIGGVKLGYQAYVAWRAALSAPPQKDIEGYSDDQLYFLAYGQSWCEKATPELLATMAHANPHSPAEWRVNGVIVNQPGFASAFKCSLKTPMNPGKPCSVW